MCTDIKMNQKQTGPPAFKTIPSTILAQQNATQMMIYSPVQTRAKTRQLHVVALYASEGTQLINTTSEFAFVPVQLKRYKYRLLKLSATISIVSQEAIFPTPQPRTYKKEEKLRGQLNFVVWCQMML